jgi:hypothetical protein
LLPEKPKSMWNMEKYADNATYVMRENAYINCPQYKQDNHSTN